MTQKQIDEVIGSYAKGAQMARALGFDGIELHGAHGYLIDQFFWSKLNHRRDRYGGDARSRGLFAAEVITECRRQLDPGMPIILRLSQWKMVEFSAMMAESPQELEQVLAPVVDAGVDLFARSDPVDLDLRSLKDASTPGVATKVSDLVVSRGCQEDSSASRVHRFQNLSRSQ